MTLAYDIQAHTLRNRFVKGELSAFQIVSYYIERIKRIDPAIGGFLTVLEERALQKARNLDEQKKQGKPLGKLAGVPVGIKDNIHIEGEPTTCASAFLTNYRAPFSATVVRRIEEEDGLIIGKTNLDEFAMGSSTEKSALGVTRNPWDVSRVPGGSSGGSAVVVSASLSPLSLGSDTGGSIRQPASFTGTVGFKPTYGRVSRFGLVAFASSMDQIGPLAGSVRDVAMMMEVIGTHCPYDATNMSTAPEEYLKALDAPGLESLKGKTIGVPDLCLKKMDRSTEALFEKGLQMLRDLGATVLDIPLKMMKYGIAIYYILSTAEASTNLARFDGIRYGNRSRKADTLDAVYDLSRAEGFGAEVKRRILLGTFVLSSGYREAYYRQAQKIRTLLIREFEETFKLCDIIATPTTPTTAFVHDTIHTPLDMYLQDAFTVSANLTGIPAISLPTGLDHQGLPGSIQLLGPQKKDKALLQIADRLERALNLGRFTPPAYAKEVDA